MEIGSYPMTSAQRDVASSPGLLTCFLSVFLVLALADLALQFLYTDFWQQPLGLQTRVGVAGYEVLVLFITLAVVAFPAWVLQRAGLTKTGRVVFVILTLPIVALLITGWSFYGNFSRFIGSFAVQMMLQDGDQLLKFVAKMPSAIDWRLVSIGVVVTLLVLLLAVVGRKPLRQVQATLSVAGCAVIMAAVVGSTLWNKPSQAIAVDDPVHARTFQRLEEAEFQLLVERAGPFTEMAGSLTKTLFSNSESISIDTARLEQIASSLPEKATTEINRYNVVFVLVESLNPDMLEAYGNNEDVMPTVNKLSENSYVLANAWAQASHSNYADISALSGQYPLRSMNIHFYPRDPAYPKSLPYDVLQPYGYRAGLFSSQNERWGLMENYLMSDAVDAFSHVGSDFRSERTAYRGIEVKSLEDGFKQYNYADFMFQGSGDGIERLDGVTTDAALAWMKSLDEEEPFFLYFNYQASHVPFNALPEGFDRKFLTDTGPQVDKIIQGDFVGEPEHYLRQAYKDSLYYVDQNIERVVSFMKETGRHSNTIYVVAADTAMIFKGALLGNGGDLYPDVLNIPAIISVPGKSGRTIIKEPVEQIDIMPTVLGLIGADPHPASQGIDLLSEKNDPERITYAVAQTPVAHQYSAIYNDWQLRHDFLHDRYTLHYAGPETDENLIRDLPEEQVQWLVEKLREWRLAQIGYYTVPQAHSLYYPPKFHSDIWQAGSGTLVGESTLDQ